MSQEMSADDSKLLSAFIRLSSQLNFTMRDDQLVNIFAQVFEELLPDRMVSIRLTKPAETELRLVYANGRLKDAERDRFRITRAAIDRLELSELEKEQIMSQGNIQPAEDYVPVFVDGTSGFAVVLCDRTDFYGVANFEYAQESVDLEADRRIATPLIRQMNAALRGSRLVSETVLLKDYLEKLLDSANAPVLVAQPSGTITVVNQAMERLTNFSREQLLGRDFISLIPEEDRARMLPLVIAAMRGEHAWNMEARIPRADGSGMAHIAFNTAPVMSSFGEIEGIIFVGQDLTEVRNLQKQVIHTEKLATLGQVAAGVAHELNNPLTSITVYTTYLLSKLKGVIEDGDMEKLGRIGNAAERIQSFTKDLVTYARPSGEEPVLLAVRDLVERGVSFCEHLIAERFADVSVDIETGLDPVYGIRGQLEQVVVNLITNACHALPQTGGSVAIRARSVDEDRLEITITDSGHGIPEANKEQIFEPFFTTKEQGEGTGLGLSIVRNILKNHDAEISVTSSLEDGTTFCVTMYKG